MQVHTMLGGLAGRSAQHRDMLCRMVALSLAALASGSLQSDTNQQLAARCTSKGSLDTRSYCCNLHGIVLWQSQCHLELRLCATHTWHITGESDSVVGND